MPPVLTALRHDLVTIDSAAMKVLALLLVVLAGAALVYGMVQPWAGAGPRWDGPRADSGRLHETVRALVALGPRHDHAGMARAADWIRARLSALGIASTTQDYRFANGDYRNVIARFGPPTPQRIVVGAHYAVDGPRDFFLTRTVKRGLASTAIPVESINAPESIPGIGNSDHRNYWVQGMSAVMITDTAWYRNPRYHTAQDTPETLDYARMLQVVDGVAAALSSIAR